MTHIVVLGAGLCGIIMAYEMKRKRQTETFCENLVLDMLGIRKLKDIHIKTAG